jgi:hypothetical protein
MKRLRAILCLFGFHRYTTHQEIFVTYAGTRGHVADTVIAWKCCDHCCKTKLLHILK